MYEWPLRKADGAPERPVHGPRIALRSADRAGQVRGGAGAAVPRSHELDVADAPERARHAVDGVGPEEGERRAAAELAVAQEVADARARAVDAGRAVREFLDPRGRPALEVCGRLDREPLGRREHRRTGDRLARLGGSRRRWHGDGKCRDGDGVFAGHLLLLSSVAMCHEPMSAGRAPASGDLPRLKEASAYLGPVIPSRAASAAAWPRECTSSLPRIAETWWSTVLWETNSRSAISELPSPWLRSTSTSTCRGVRLAVFWRVPGRRPRGSPRAPRARRRLATMAAAGRAPIR